MNGPQNIDGLILLPQSTSAQLYEVLLAGYASLQRDGKAIGHEGRAAITMIAEVGVQEARRISAKGSVSRVAEEAEQTLTTRQASEVLRTTPRRVRQLLQIGKLSGERRGRDWLLDRESVKRYEEGRN